MKSKKFIIIFVCIFSLIFGAICFDTHYAVIDKKIYKNDIKKIDPSLVITSVREINVSLIHYCPCRRSYA